MKKSILLLLFACSLFCTSAQSPIYQSNLYRLCKTWGYFKYFHSEVSTCKVNWDSVLLATIPMAKASQSEGAFDTVLYTMLVSAGPMEEPLIPAVQVLPQLNVNYDTTWIRQLNFSPRTTDLLSNVATKFRPHASCYVVQNSTSTHGYLQLDDTVAVNNPNYPDEPSRLLIAFRYWNIIRYFNPNNSLMDTPWDSTLNQFVLRFANAPNATEYNLTLLEFISKTDDTHASTIGNTITSNYFGNYFPNFKVEVIENKTVVTNIYGTSSLKIGDVIERINGVQTDSLRSNNIKYIAHSNIAALNRDMNTFILRGASGSIMNIDFVRDGVTSSIQITRNFSISEFYYYLYNVNKNLPLAKRYTAYNTGYMNLGNIASESQLQPVFDSLRTLPNIIFDMRNYPNFSVPYSPFFKNIAFDVRWFSLLTIPDVTFPGVLSSISPIAFGSSNPSNTYYGNIYVLVNEETQSASEFSVMALQSLPYVTIIGSQTAGADGNVTKLNLSNSFKANFSTLQPRYPDGTIAQRAGIKINVPVIRTIKGVSLGKDEILEKAFSITTSLPTNIANNNSIEIYPNPSRGILNISATTEMLNPTKILIYNMSGILIYDREYSSLPTSLDLSSFKNGLYIIKLEQEKKSFVKKLYLLN